jgi:hypothetical protein
LRHILYKKSGKPIGSQQEQGRKYYGKQGIPLKGKRQQHTQQTDLGKPKYPAVLVVQNLFVHKKMVQKGSKRNIYPTQKCYMGMCMYHKPIIDGHRGHYKSPQQHP